MTQAVDNSVEYARRLYDNVLGWYHSADTKAQVVLGIDGAFAAFLTSGIFAKPDDLRSVLTAFSGWTWFLLLLMMASLLLSICAAIYCLRSRIYSEAEINEIVATSTKAIRGTVLYAPNVMFFFQMVAALEDDRFRRTLEQVDGEFETTAMASEIHTLSGNVQKKHRAANFGFLFAALTLALFLMAGVSYALRIAF